MNLFEIASSTAAPSVAGCRSRLEAAEEAAIDSAVHSDLIPMFQQLARDGDSSAARAELYFFDLPEVENITIRQQIDAIESAWHALQQAERRALRTLKP